MFKRGICVVLMLVLVGIVYMAFTRLTTEPLLTEAETTVQVEKAYNGEVQNIFAKQKQYMVAFKKGGSMYEVAVDARTGKMTDLQLIHQAEIEQKPEPEPEPEQKPESPIVLLTERDAVAIALGEVAGEFDSSEFVSTSDGGYYLVEVEQQEDEIMVQVHAITGKILSIQYED